MCAEFPNMCTELVCAIYYVKICYFVNGSIHCFLLWAVYSALYSKFSLSELLGECIESINKIIYKPNP